MLTIQFTGEIAELRQGGIDAIEELEQTRLMFGGEDVKPGKSLVHCKHYYQFAVPAAGTAIGA